MGSPSGPKGFVSRIGFQEAAFLAAVGDDLSNPTRAEGETRYQPRILRFPFNPLALKRSSEEHGIEDEA